MFNEFGGGFDPTKPASWPEKTSDKDSEKAREVLRGTWRDTGAELVEGLTAESKERQHAQEVRKQAEALADIMDGNGGHNKPDRIAEIRQAIAEETEGLENTGAEPLNPEDFQQAA